MEVLNVHRHEHIEFIRKSFADNEFEDAALRSISAIGCDTNTDDAVNGLFVAPSNYLARAKAPGDTINYGLFSRIGLRKYEIIGEYRGLRVPLVHAGTRATYQFQVERKFIHDFLYMQKMRH
jgi:hypothetical protein